MQDVVIVELVRSPIGKRGGGLGTGTIIERVGINRGAGRACAAR